MIVLSLVFGIGWTVSGCAPKPPEPPAPPPEEENIEPTSPMEEGEFLPEEVVPLEEDIP